MAISQFPWEDFTPTVAPVEEIEKKPWEKFAAPETVERPEPDVGDPSIPVDRAEVKKPWEEFEPMRSTEDVPEDTFLGDVKLAGKVIGTGAYSAFADMFPKIFAEAIRGGTLNVDTSTTALGRFINEQKADLKRWELSPEERENKLFGIIKAQSVLEGLQNVGYGAAIGTVGMVAGAGAGLLVPEPTPAAEIIGGVLGAGLLTGPVMYRASQDQFVSDMLDNVKKKRPDITQGEWTEVRDALMPSARLYGLYEAVPEVVGNMFMAALIKIPAGKLVTRIPLIKNTIARVVASAGLKLGLNIPVEIGTETITQKGQAGIEAELGLRAKAPTWEESYKEIAGPTLVTAVAGLGMGSAVNRIAQAQSELTQRQPAPVAPETGGIPAISVEGTRIAKKVASGEQLNRGDMDILDTMSSPDKKEYLNYVAKLRIAEIETLPPPAKAEVKGEVAPKPTEGKVQKDVDSFESEMLSKYGKKWFKGITDYEVALETKDQSKIKQLEKDFDKTDFQKSIDLYTKFKPFDEASLVNQQKTITDIRSQIVKEADGNENVANAFMRGFGLQLKYPTDKLSAILQAEHLRESGFTFDSNFKDAVNSLSDALAKKRGADSAEALMQRGALTSEGIKEFKNEIKTLSTKLGKIVSDFQQNIVTPLPPPAPTPQTAIGRKPITTPEAGAGALPTIETFHARFDVLKKTGLAENKIRGYLETDPRTGNKAHWNKMTDTEKAGAIDVLTEQIIEKEEAVEKGPPIKPRIPVSEEAVGRELVSTRDIIRQIEVLFGLPIRVGRYRATAAGIYKVKPEVIRTRAYGDIASVAHEAGHHLDKMTRITRVIPAELKPELGKLDYDQQKLRQKEGFSEYIRLKTTTDTDASTQAPNFDVWFERVWLPENPEWKSKLEQITNLVRQWRQEGGVNRVKAQINKDSGRFRAIKGFIKDPMDSFRGIYDALWNRQQPLWRAMYKMAKTIKLSDVTAKFRFAQAAKTLNMAAPAKVKQMVETGMTDVTGHKIAPGLKESLDPINESLRTIEEQKDFEAFLYARHAIDVHKSGKNPGILLEDAKTTVRELGQRPGWNRAAESITRWFDGLLDYLIDAGGLTSEGKAAMKKLYPNYIPLFRVMDTKDAGGKAGGKKIADIGQPIYRLGGSGRQITSPFENAVVYAERMVSIADKIRVGGMIADAAKHYGGVGDIIEKVPPDIVAKSATLKALQEQLLNANVNLDAADLNSMITIFENVYRGSSKDNIIVLWRDGKQEMYQVDPDVYRALTNLDQQFQLPKVLDWIFGKPARLLRLATTGLRAGFSMITNPLRDTMTSVMQTRTEGFQGTLPGKIADNIAGIYWDLAGTESARLFKAGGGEMGQPLGIDRVFLQEAVHEMLAKTPRQKVMNWARHPVDSLRQLFSITELGPRLAEFVRVAKARGWKGEGHRMTFEQYLDAQMAAADVTVDFRQGGWLSMWLNRITAFHNANMQGPVQMVQAFKRKPAETTAKGILWLTLPTLGLWWANKDKDWYRDMSDFEKFGYWHIDVNGTVLRIPRPFEWGILFASIPEALIEWAYKQDPQYVKDVMGQSFQILTPPIVPSAVTPITETIFNWDTFRRRPVVSRGMQYLRPEDQSYTTTTETAKKLGQILGVSPASIEFLMAGYTGTMSTEIIRAGESALRSAGLLTKKGARPGELSDIPVVGRLFLRPNTTKVFDEFYSKVEALNQTHSSAKLHGTKMLPSEARQRVVFNSSVKRLKDLRERSRKVIDNVAISDAQKRTNLQLIQDKMVRVAKLALKQNEK